MLFLTPPAWVVCVAGSTNSLCNGLVSVCSSICLSIPSVARRTPRVCCWAPNGQQMSIDCCAAGAQRQRRRSTTLSSRCEQCRVDGWRTKLNTDSLRPVLCRTRKTVDSVDSVKLVSVRGVGTARATGALAPAMLKPRGREYLFAPQYFPTFLHAVP